MLNRVVQTVTRNLDVVIDVNYYPIPQAELSNKSHRPIGIGVQGLADVFALLGLAWESPEAAQLNRDIFETIYYAALTASCARAREFGTYASYEGSPIQQRGELQCDMWGVEPSPRWDWAALRAEIAVHGLRNSLLVAPMPTASTAQILGNNEAFEPFTTNIYARRTHAGDFFVVNKHLVRDLRALGLWTPEMMRDIIAKRGSVQHIVAIPQRLRDVYKTVWEISQRTIINMAADRGAFIDQSQSLNVHMGEPTFAKLTSLHFYAWRKGLKTGMYYLRTRPAANAIQFTVDQEATITAPVAVAPQPAVADEPEPAVVANETDDEVCYPGCLNCGS
jgi:ribonucleotide reductase alpha subunit